MIERTNILNRARCLTDNKYDNIFMEVSKFNYRASIVVKNMGDAFTIKFTEASNRAVIDTRGCSKEKDFLDSLMEASDSVVYSKGMEDSELNNKKVVIFKDIYDFEEITAKLNKGRIVLFILLTDNESLFDYYPVIKFKESQIYSKKFFFNMDGSNER